MFSKQTVLTGLGVQCCKKYLPSFSQNENPTVEAVKRTEGVFFIHQITLRS